MGVFDRPHAGNWVPNRKGVIRYTPDAVLFLNGDVSVTSSKAESTKQKKIDIQRYITQISVDSGVEAGSCSGSFTMSIPNDIGSSLFSDGHSVFQPGLEVHIYMRGYFPVEGMANTLDATEVKALRDALGDNATDLALRPYYHCFHGVTTTANIDYSGGFYSINMSCTGMLHFWQYHDISTNASLFGTRPTGSKLKMSLVGHNFTNMTPFSIIYSLYKDTAGAAGGVAFALSASSNQAKKFFGTGNSLFEMTQKYWEQRFRSKVYNLRMFGVNGEQLNSVQTAMIGRMTTKQLNTAAEINLRHTGNTQTEPSDLFRGNEDIWKMATDVKDARRYTQGSFPADRLQYMPRAGEKSGVAVSAAQLKAFVHDISQWGNVNLWEASYTSKLDIASAAATAVGYEFYQDVDGDLVFKPPLYNLDTRNLEAYRIAPQDLISITRAAAEPTATYMTVKSSAFSNMTGVGLDGEWGIRGQYIDYPLVAKFGWRPGDLDAQFYSSARGAFWAAVARIDILNEAMNSANITIPLRPELRPGFPVYVEHLDCFYYIKSMSHSFSYGGQCTTSLQCVARREKFMAPGDSNQSASGDANGINGVRLDRVDLPNFPLVMEDKGSGEGAVKFAGFPNVVMALDPAGISPFAWALGQDVLDLSNAQNVRNMVLLLCGHDSKQTLASFKDPAQKEPLIRESSSSLATTSTSGAGAALSETKAKALFDTTSTVGAADLWVRVPRLGSGSSKYVTKNGSIVWDYKQLKISEIEKQVETYKDFMEKQKEDVGKGGADFDVTGDWQDTLTDYIKAYEKKAIGTVPKGTADIFDLLTSVLWVLGNQAHEPDKLDSAQILNLLGDKKSNFSNASTPGYYRYYSSAHPVGENQAPTRYTFTMPGSGGANIKDAYDDMADASHGMFHAGSNADKVPKAIQGMDNLKKRFAAWDDSKQSKVRAFRVAKAGSRTEDLPTDQIYTLVFSQLGIDLKAMVPSSHTGAPSPASGLEKALAEALVKRWGIKYGPPAATDTMEDWFGPILAELDSLAIPGAGTWWTAANNPFGKHTPPPTSVTAKWDGALSALSWGLEEEFGSNVRADFPHSDLDASQNKDKTVDMSKVKASHYFLHNYCKGGKSPKGNDKCKCYKKGRRQIQRADRPRFDEKEVDMKKLSHGVYTLAAKAVAFRLYYILKYSAVAWGKIFKTKAQRNTDAAKDGFLELNSFQKAICDTFNLSGEKWLKPWAISASGHYNATGSFRRKTKVLSPVFPISDAGGYRHYGSYAYGRGLRIGEEGQGFEKLLAQDPLETLDDTVIDKFVRDILKEGSTKLALLSGFGTATAATGAATPTMLDALMLMQTTNPAAFSRLQRTLKVATDDDKAIVSTAQYIEQKGITGSAATRKVMAAGLINYFQREDTPGSTTDPLNAAYNIVDIFPGGGLDPVAGNEILYDSMVRMIATDESKFIYVSPDGKDGDLQTNVVKTVQQQVVESSIDHTIIQDALRGQIEKPRDAIDFANMFDNWGGDGNWENSAAGQAFQKLATAFSDAPDDPRLADLYDKLNEVGSTQHNRWMEIFDGDADEWHNPAQAQDDLNESVAEHMTDWEEGKATSWPNDETGWYYQTFKGDAPPEEEDMYTDQGGNVGSSEEVDEGDE